MREGGTRERPLRLHLLALRTSPVPAPPPESTPAATPPRQGRLVSTVLTIVGLVAVFLLFRHLDAGALHRLVAASGLLLVAILGPNTVTFFLDTVAWYSCFPPDDRPTFGQVLAVRIAGESLTNALPGGVVVGEVWKLQTLAREAPAVPRDTVIGSLALAKLALASSQVVFVCLGALLGLRTLWDTVGHGSLLGIFATLAAFLAFFFGPVLLVRRSHHATRARGGASALHPGPDDDGPGLRARLARLRLGAARLAFVLGEQVGDAVRHRRKAVGRAFLLSFSGWVIGAGETYLALHALGIPIGIAESLTLESLGTIFRMVFFLAPGGIGAQDWGFTALLAAPLSQSQAPDPVSLGASFALVKRARELVWIALGLLLVLVFALKNRLRPKAAGASS
jgi:glycosyltransferase 2 family protein